MRKSLIQTSLFTNNTILKASYNRFSRPSFCVTCPGRLTIIKKKNIVTMAANKTFKLNTGAEIPAFGLGMLIAFLFTRSLAICLFLQS